MFSEYKTIESLDAFKQDVDRQYAERKEIIEMVNKAISLSDKPFSFIKESFENLSPRLFETKAGKKILSKYVSTIKGDKNLSGLHSINESVRKMSKDGDVEHFMTNICSFDWGVDKNTVNESVKKLGDLLSEAYLVAGEKADELLPSDKEELSKAIEFVAENKMSKKNLHEFSCASKVIKEYISKNEPIKESKTTSNIDEMVEKLVGEFNDKYAGKLNEDEVYVVKGVSNSKNAEHLFDKYKKSCNSKLDEQKKMFEKDGDIESAKRISAIQESLSAKKFSQETINEDIANLLEMSNLFD